MERDGRDLETKTDDDEQDRQDQRRFVLHARGGLRDAGEGDLSGEAVEEREPVEQDGGGEDAEDEVLHRSLVRLDVTLSPPGQQIEGAGGQLEGDEEDDQITGRCHDHRAQERGDEQEVVLALVVTIGLDVVV